MTKYCRDCGQPEGLMAGWCDEHAPGSPPASESLFGDVFCNRCGQGKSNAERLCPDCQRELSAIPF